MMLAWSDCLETLKNGAQVIEFKKICWFRIVILAVQQSLIKRINQQYTMTTLQISDHTASILSNLAQQEQLSSSELIEKYHKEHELLEDLMESLPNLRTFKGTPMEIQKTMRDEWS